MKQLTSIIENKGTVEEFKKIIIQMIDNKQFAETEQCIDSLYQTYSKDVLSRITESNLYTFRECLLHTFPHLKKFTTLMI